MAILDVALVEYEAFLKEYLFDLLGIRHLKDKIKNVYGKVDYKGAVVVKTKDKVYFSTDKDTLFEINYPYLTDDNKSLAINIIQSFFNVSVHHMTKEKEDKPNREYKSNVQKTANYKMAIQRGICNWIVGQNKPYVEELFEILETWSVQTYEGKR